MADLPQPPTDGATWTTWAAFLTAVVVSVMAGIGKIAKIGREATAKRDAALAEALKADLTRMEARLSGKIGVLDAKVDSQGERVARVEGELSRIGKNGRELREDPVPYRAG